MSTLQQFLQKERKLNWKFWLNYYHQWFLGLIYNKSIKSDDNWKGVKIQSTIIPNGWTKDGVFTYLEKENQNKIWKR